MMEIEHDIAALHEHEKMSRNAVADGEAVLHAEAVEQAEEEAAHEATEADESSLNKELEIEYADQTEITNIEAEIAADQSFIDTLGKHIEASTVRSPPRRCQLRFDCLGKSADIHYRFTCSFSPCIFMRGPHDFSSWAWEGRRGASIVACYLVVMCPSRGRPFPTRRRLSLRLSSRPSRPTSSASRPSSRTSRPSFRRTPRPAPLCGKSMPATSPASTTTRWRSPWT
mmetsp:Transcript_61009/g.163829  ORF Transcript_61009/g.163829 Transcript_61009/m.163829 type:complete len:227 (+) Transcript_61009:806-1486(+)